jgi:hypothetical protein
VHRYGSLSAPTAHIFSMIGIADADSSKKRRRRRNRPFQEQKFSSYLSFNAPVTLCLCVFLLVYALVLLCASPLLQQAAPTDTNLERGAVLQPMVENFKNLPKQMPVMAAKLKDQLHNLRQRNGIADSNLIQQAQHAMEQLRQGRKGAVPAAAGSAAAAAGGNKDAVVEKQAGDRRGVVVLGMHRSGTSLLSGLLVNSLGYNVGGPLIGSASDNEKGFFELLDAVLQNDEFMNLQNVWWSANLMAYDSNKALEQKKNGQAKFHHGARALEFLNDEANVPWLQKDPRMCITLKTWLPLLNSDPAILWTYRHPMEVAHSLMHRESGFTLDHGLRLWIVYNMRGLQNSADLCRVYSSNDAIMASPLTEVQRLVQELTTKCGVPRPPNELTQEEVDKFVDPSLQHNAKGKYGQDRPVIVKHGTCEIHELTTDTLPGSPAYEIQLELYLLAMGLYCDMESGAAYKDDYTDWPELPK